LLKKLSIFSELSGGLEVKAETGTFAATKDVTFNGVLGALCGLACTASNGTIAITAGVATGAGSDWTTGDWTLIQGLKAHTMAPATTNTMTATTVHKPRFINRGW
jgi:hypothetical protein